MATAWQFAGACVRKASPAFSHALRMAVSVCLALFVAFYLQLDNPSWAGTSAGIICQPVLGSSLRKGFYRAVGAMVGAIATVLLSAWFPQDRVGFLFGMALWAAACSFISTMLKNFAAYAAMLAGYTMPIIASASISSPDHVFEVAVARASDIIVGIVCATIVLAGTDLGSSRSRLRDSFSRLVGDISRHVATRLEGAKRDRSEAGRIRQDLVTRIASLDTTIDEAIGESHELRRRSGILYAGMNGLFEAVSGLRTLDRHLPRSPEGTARDVGARSGLPQPPRPGASRQPTRGEAGWSALRDRYAASARTLAELRSPDVSTCIVADALAQVALGLKSACNGLTLLSDPARATEPEYGVSRAMPDSLVAAWGALRVFVAVSAAILFWILTSWDSALSAVTFVAVTTLLLSSLGAQAPAAATGFGLGSVVAAAAAAMVKFALLPNHETFLSFALISGSAVMVLAALSHVPKLERVFTAAAMNFTPLLAPTNEITYDTTTFYNNALGIVAGCCGAAVALRVIPALPSGFLSWRALDLMLADVRRLARARVDAGSSARWQQLVYARLLALPKTADPVAVARIVAALTMGMQIVRLRQSAKRGETSDAIARALQALANGHAAGAARILRATDSTSATPRMEETQARLRSRADLQVLEETLDAHVSAFGGHAS